MQKLRNIFPLLFVIICFSYGCSELSDITTGKWLGQLDANDADADSVEMDARDARDDSDIPDDVPADVPPADVPDECTAADHQSCVGGSLYWFDSCGNKQDLVRECACGCIASACTPCKDCPDGFVKIEPGVFTMGSYVHDLARLSSEIQHEVTLKHAFCMMENELTQADWRSVVGNNPSYFEWCGNDCPVEMVSWWDAVAFCNSLSEREGLQKCYELTDCIGAPGNGDHKCAGVKFEGVSCNGYRLPTEAEWEYTARAGTISATYKGNSLQVDCSSPNSVLDPIAWYMGNSCDIAPPNVLCRGGSHCQTHPVKGKEANAWGLYDMLGNVYEWVWDWNGVYTSDPVTDPIGPTSGSYRGLRGGGWISSASWTRAANRDYTIAEDRNSHTGFRPARTMCLPRCGGLDCGDDGCEGSCGSCDGGKECVQGTCTCVTHHHTECDGLDLVWFDSCGNREDNAKTCTCSCSGGACGACGCPVGYVPVPAGTFNMGSAPGDSVCAGDDEAQHVVTIGSALCMKETEVTQTEFSGTMGFNPSFFNIGGSQIPVETLSWWNAVAYCNKLSDQYGLPNCYTVRGCTETAVDPGYHCNTIELNGLDCPGFRLPTEAEWEFAARAGTTGQTYNGSHDNPDTCDSCETEDAVLDEIAWWCGNSGKGTKPVKTLQPNNWGLFDMIGNVGEWVWDWYDAYPTGPLTDPTGAADGTRRVVRGGAFGDPASLVRAAARTSADPGDGTKTKGFRPVRWACSSNADCTLEKSCDSATGLCVEPD